METPSIEVLSEFFEKRKKSPHIYTYSDTGNLIQKNEKGDIINTITLPTYIHPSSNELMSKYEERKTQISSAETNYDEQRKILYNLTETNSPMNEILRQNKITEEAEQNIINKRYPLRMAKALYSIDIKDIHFEEKYEKRKVPYPIMSMKTLPMSLQNMYIQSKPELSTIPIASLPQTIKTDDKKIFVDSNTDINEYLSLEWASSVVYNNVQYISAYQALMAELAKLNSDNERYQKIIQAKTSSEINYDSEYSPENQIKIKELLFPIQISKFQQHPELSKKLINTGDSDITVIENKFPFLSIIPEGETTNYLGKILVQVRNELKKTQKPKRVLKIVKKTSVLPSQRI